MAKKEITMVGIEDLATEYNLESKTIRIILRKGGFAAPKIADATGFGPKTKYEWPSDSDELEKIDTLLTTYIENKKNPPVKASKASKPPVEQSPDEDGEDGEEDGEEEAPKAVVSKKKKKKK